MKKNTFQKQKLLNKLFNLTQNYSILILTKVEPKKGLVSLVNNFKNSHFGGQFLNFHGQIFYFYGEFVDYSVYNCNIAENSCQKSHGRNLRLSCTRLWLYIFIIRLLTIKNYFGNFFLIELNSILKVYGSILFDQI